MLIDDAMALIERWYGAAIAAVEPSTAVQTHLARDDRALLVGKRRISVPSRLLVIGVGKAAVAMARGAEAACGDLVTDGLVVTKDDHATPPLPRCVRVAEAGHPIPDERGVAATRAILDLLADLTPEDVVLALISGGGSALLEAPVPPLTLADLAAVTDLLLRAGAPIHHLNAVRTPLSLVKGGGLRRAAAPATLVTLILSDVLGNDPRVIASGPTVPATPDPETALALVERYGIRDQVPTTVIRALSPPPGPSLGNLPSPVHGRGAGGEGRSAVGGGRPDDVLQIVGDNATAVDAIAAAAQADGHHSAVVWHDRAGEAADLARAWVDACLAAPAATDVLLGGGEATVTVRGDGRGGRNTEFALAAALALHDQDEHGWAIASLATDGDDGPTGAAGAIADGQTVARALAAGLDPAAALARNDSLPVFEAAGGLLRPGPTGTNVNDLYLALRLR